MVHLLRDSGKFLVRSFLLFQCLFQQLHHLLLAEAFSISTHGAIRCHLVVFYPLRA